MQWFSADIIVINKN